MAIAPGLGRGVAGADDGNVSRWRKQLQLSRR